MTEIELLRVAATTTDYCPDTGVFTHNENTKQKWLIGKSKGYIDPRGYRRLNVTVDGVKRKIQSHRLAWFMVHGVAPPHMIDHIDRNESNNKLSNLRLATNTENQMNARSRSSSSSKHKGVSYFKKNNNWRAYIRFNKENIYLGSFDEEKDAAKAYNKAAVEYFGEFANLNQV